MNFSLEHRVCQGLFRPRRGADRMSEGCIYCDGRVSEGACSLEVKGGFNRGVE